MPSSSAPKSDPYIVYGRGGAGNIHHRSTIRSAWKSIKNSPSTSPPLTASVSPDNYYAAWNAKSEDPRKARRESQLASSASSVADGADIKRNTSSGSLSFLKRDGDGVKRNTSSGSLFSLSRSDTGSRSHNGLSGLSKIFGRRSSVEDDRSVSTSTTVESVQEEDADAMVMRRESLCFLACDLASDTTTRRLG
ncbi:uncharacterized protein M421DRAFT_347307 [Didymella exigua CBS 183.55]|uniref:Uncharacterized protein n=1 Tax=Didymella exigua CBS 183.55 TaxID=1150837 RepID=A0A6A5RVT2_9PLEO|nr:uncharacterized protein M421DRAFT_347307 [Didymella exigua CBS 183.55]KAF1931430.1 hypothetical protein M421DRAFT_347307 [Didymella exigua CBS 183.55]